MGITPQPDPDLQQILAAMDRRITNLEQANPLQGGVVISGGGFTGVDPTTGNEVFKLGLGVIPDGTDRPQMGTVLKRDDGSIAFEVWDAGIAYGHTHHQSVVLRDRSGNIIVADDTTSGAGLANPHVVAGGLQDTNISTWPATNAASFTTISENYMEIQNAQVAWVIRLLADAGTTAEFALFVGGVQIGSTQTVTAGFSLWEALPGALPPGTTIASIPRVDLQARVTAGPGSARAQCLLLAGWQT